MGPPNARAEQALPTGDEGYRTRLSPMWLRDVGRSRRAGGERHQHLQRAERGHRFIDEPSCRARVPRQELFAVPFFPAVALYVKGWSVAFSPGPAVSVTGTVTPAFFASAFVRPEPETVVSAIAK